MGVIRCFFIVEVYIGVQWCKYYDVKISNSASF